MWIFYAFCSALFASLVAIFSKIGLKDIDSTFATTIRAIVMALFLFVIALSFGKFKDFSFSLFESKAWFYIILSGIAGALSWLFYFYALKYGSATAVSAIDRLSIVFVAILATIFLSESITIYKILGVFLVAIGVFLTVFK